MVDQNSPRFGTSRGSKFGSQAISSGLNRPLPIQIGTTVANRVWPGTLHSGIRWHWPVLLSQKEGNVGAHSLLRSLLLSLPLSLLRSLKQRKAPPRRRRAFAGRASHPRRTPARFISPTAPPCCPLSHRSASNAIRA